MNPRRQQRGKGSMRWGEKKIYQKGDRKKIKKSVDKQNKE